MAKRRKRPPKSAYLKRARTFPDPHHPWAMKTRSSRAINIAGLMHDPKTGLLYDAGTPTTITHGTRGLTIARAQGPTAVSLGSHGKPTVIPKMEIKLKQEQVEARRKSPSGRLEHWHHILYSPENMNPHYSLELFFHGREWKWVERTLECELRSRSYPTKERAEEYLKPGRWSRVIWEERIPLNNTS